MYPQRHADNEDPADSSESVVEQRVHSSRGHHGGLDHRPPTRSRGDNWREKRPAKSHEEKIVLPPFHVRPCILCPMTLY